MAINPFYGDFKNEQRLVDDLTIETIRAMGRDVYYIPREYVKLDTLFGEDILSKFKYAFPIEMYVEDVYRFGGQRDIVSKFGIEITDRLTLQVSITRFKQEITVRNNEIKKPREGDLIYFPLSKHLFEINYVEDELPFYQHGALTTYTFQCELFTYSNEKLETGMDDIDEVETLRKMYLTKITLGSGITGTSFLKGDTVYQVNGITFGNYSNATYTATVVDYIDGATDFLYVSDGTGTLYAGITSQSVLNKNKTVGYYVSSSEVTNINASQYPHILESSGDNKELDILQNTNNLFDFTEKDPFSEGKY